MAIHFTPTLGIDGINPAPLQQPRGPEDPSCRIRTPFLQSLLTRTTPGGALAFDRVLAPAFLVGKVDFLPWSYPYGFSILDLSRSLGSLNLDGPQPRDSDESAKRHTNGERNSYRANDINSGTNYPNNRDLPPSANTRSHHRQDSDGGGSPPRGRQAEGRSFNPYGPSRSTRETNGFIRDILLRRHADADEGYVYGFQHPDDVDIGPSSSSPGGHKWAPPLVKIGRSREHQKRMRQIRKQCGYPPRSVFAHFMPRHGMVERVVHTQLHNLRLRDVGCTGCGVRHEEWFQVDVRYAEDIVELWKAFVECSPYDEQGSMLPEWRTRLEQLDLDHADCWQRFVDGSAPARPAVGSPQELEAESAHVDLAAGHTDPASDGGSGGGEHEEDREAI